VVNNPNASPEPEGVNAPSTNRRLFGYLSLQSSGTMVSRAIGFVRELVSSYYFGVSAAADTFFAALTIPTLFRDVLGEDVVERSFMPGVREELARGNKDRAWRLASASLNWMMIGIALVSVLVWWAAPWLVTVVAQGLEQRGVDAAALQDVVKMTRILVPFIALIALAAFVGGLLYYGYDLHLPFSLAPATLSIGVITSLALFADDIGVYALAWGFVIGAALQFLVQVPFLWMRRVRRMQPHYTPTLRPPSGTSRRLSRETLYVTLQSVLTKTTEVVDRRVASFLVSGSISSLWFAARLVQLPLAIIGIAIARAVTPHLSERHGVGDTDGFKEGVLIGYRYNLLLILPVTALLIVLAEPIVRLVFERGNFSADDVEMTALAFWCYATGLLGMSLYTLGSRVCSALGRNRVATFTAAVGAGVNIWLNYELSATSLRHGGLALATAIGFTVNATLLFSWLHRHLRVSGAGFSAGELLVPILRVAVNTAFAAWTAWFTLSAVAWLSLRIDVSQFLTNAFAVAVPFATGGLVYVIVSLVNPVPEVMPLVRRIQRVVRR
jgi:putative peptidoglycan lipid II flippase